MMRVQFGWIGQKSLAGKEIKWGKENHHRMHSFAALPPGAAHNKTTKIKARKKDFNKGRVAESKNLAQKMIKEGTQCSGLWPWAMRALAVPLHPPFSMLLSLLLVFGLECLFHLEKPLFLPRQI